MTDNEIIKVLECCEKPVGEGCKECPLYNTDCTAINLDAIALDLINRQKAEIEKKDTEIDILIRKKEALRDEISELTAEVERLQKANQSFADIGKLYSEIKSEAYMEFNARLYAYKTDIFIKGEELMIIPFSDYEIILKELTESKNDFEG